MKTCGEANFSTICPTPSATTVPGATDQRGCDSGHIKRDPSRWFHLTKKAEQRVLDNVHVMFSSPPMPQLHWYDPDRIHLSSWLRFSKVRHRCRPAQVLLQDREKAMQSKVSGC